MDISKIDKNLAVVTKIERKGLVWLDAAESPFVTYGAFSKNPYLRMPLEVAKTVSDGVYDLSQHTAGIRLRFRTNSPYIAIHCEWKTMCRVGGHMTFAGSSGFDLFKVSDNHKQSYVKTFVPDMECEKGFESIYDANGKMTDYVLNFPLYNYVSKLFIGVSENAEFETPLGYSNEQPVVFYGSSITQGGCASRPGNCYQNHLSRAFDMDYVNLGFSGNGQAEDTMIEYLSNLSMSVFVSDYDHNAPGWQHLEKTHYKLYEGIRSKHPDIPYIMISKPDFNVNSEDENLRRAVILNSYKKAYESGDRNVYFIDGASIFDGDQFDACTVDGCHPNDLGFYCFYKALLPTFSKIFNK